MKVWFIAGLLCYTALVLLVRKLQMAVYGVADSAKWASLSHAVHHRETPLTPAVQSL